MSDFTPNDHAAWITALKRDAIADTAAAFEDHVKYGEEKLAAADARIAELRRDLEKHCAQAYALKSTLEADKLSLEALRRELEAEGA